MGNWWIHELYQQGRIVELISWTFWVIFSITLHELAHGWAAIWQGDSTPRRTGHMTANPIVHMGPWSLIMFALIGIAWGMMPVDPSRFRWGRKGRIIVSGAGPAMNIALALIALTVLAFWLRFAPGPSALSDNISIFLFTGGWLNILLAMLNMLPVPPLDGASVLSGFSFRMWQLYQNPQAQMFGMFILLAIFFTPIGRFIFVGGEMLAGAYLRVWASILS